jgi:hypothetical protein
MSLQHFVPSSWYGYARVAGQPLRTGMWALHSGWSFGLQTKYKITNLVSRFSQKVDSEPLAAAVAEAPADSFTTLLQCSECLHLQPNQCCKETVYKVRNTVPTALAQFTVTIDRQ